MSQKQLSKSTIMDVIDPEYKSDGIQQSEIRRILKFWSCRIQIFCFGPTLQVWI